MRHASVYRRDGRYFVHAFSQTSDGLLLLCEPVFAISEGEGEAALGRAVVAALEAFRENVPTPLSARGLVAPLLKMSGARSWAAFARTAECVEVSEDAGRFALVPTRNLGAKGGFKHLAEVAYPGLDDPAQLGAVILEVLRSAK